MEQGAGSREQGADSRQQTADSRQQAADSRLDQDKNSALSSPWMSSANNSSYGVTVVLQWCYSGITVVSQ
jgi:hypothetical protein